MPSTVKKVFKALDLYRYQRLFEEDCYTHSWHSYLFTFVLVFTIVFLVAGEIVGHLKPIYTQDLFVDEILDNQKMAVDFDVLFMTVPCHFIDITVSDITGNMEHNISKHIVRTRLDHKGRVLGDQDEDAMIDQAEHKEVLVKENDEYESLLQSDFQHDGHVEELHTRNGLETFIKAHKKPRELVFIDFYAPWCIWCQRLEPVFAKLGQEVGSKGPIFVGRIDCTKDENIDACQSQHVHSFPTMLFFRHGEEHPFESYQGERTVAVSERRVILERSQELQKLRKAENAMKKRAVEIARGDPQSAADQKKIELHKADGARGPPVGTEQCRILGTVLVNQVPSQLRFHLTSPRHSIDPNMINATHEITDLHFSLDLDHLTTLSAKQSVLARKAHPLRHLTSLKSRALMPNFIGNTFQSNTVNQTFSHYLKLVPEEKVTQRKTMESFMFTHYGGEHIDLEDVASVVLDIDVSSVGIRSTQTYQPLYALITRLLAVLGGAFSVVNVVRGFTAEVVKITIGKQD